MFTRPSPFTAVLASAAWLTAAVLVPSGVSALSASDVADVAAEVSPVTGAAPDYDLTLSPAPDSDAGDSGLTFQVKLMRSAGGGTYLPAAGDRVDFGLAGSGSIVGAVPSGPNPGTCVTSTAGTCTVTIRSSDPAGSTLAAMSGDEVATIGVGAAAPTR